MCTTHLQSSHYYRWDREWVRLEAYRYVGVESWAKSQKYIGKNWNIKVAVLGMGIIRSLPFQRKVVALKGEETIVHAC